MNKWSNLPNAKHIDCVLQSVKDNPDEWAAAYYAAYNAAWASAHDAAYDAAYNSARGAAWNAARNAARNAAYSATYNAAWGAARDAARDVARYAAYNAAYNAARYAILALMSYDDIEHYFLSSHEELRLIAELSQHPAAILLLPAIKARELIEVKNERVV